MRTQHSHTDDQTTIAIADLPRTLTLLHITDSHVALADDRDPDALAYVAADQARFAERTPGNVPAAQLLQRALQHARDLDADGTALTGDIIHYPSHAGIDFVADGVHALPGQYLYTMGNHDWYFPHLDWNDDTRQAHYSRFAGVTAPSPAAQTLDLDGVRLLAIDNSNYHMSPDQLSYLHRQLNTPLPCLLFVHIPIAVPTLMPDVCAVWQDPIVMAATGWTAAGREKWRIREDDESTLAARDLLARAENLVAIFCGHVHFPHADQVSPTCYQYITRPCFEGGYREIRLEPLS